MDGHKRRLMDFLTMNRETLHPHAAGTIALLLSRKAPMCLPSYFQYCLNRWQQEAAEAAAAREKCKSGQK